ncbi:MAG: MogA/MoaB family molybdenum cofactor biosynthesis protein [Bryobacteraceae bacterium]|nr:MogA/MoaB family molybdenum cofactor biosynthesis protein [Bryobacteraceae bacterium]MDW8377213.1 MogA/MoaB family molybdenum cofactor biosynthesis protein [Bryobacterales bacterium]
MIQVAILTISDSCSQGERQDRSGPALREFVERLGWQVASQEILPDERRQIGQRLREFADAQTCQLILATGGTGLGPRDVTPEAVRDVIEREIPGLGEQMRAYGRQFTPLASLSRSLAGTRGQTLIVALPGSPKGAVQSLEAIADLIPHLVDLLQGRSEHPYALKLGGAT